MDNTLAIELGIHEKDGLQTLIWRHCGGGASFRCALCGEWADYPSPVSITLFDGQERRGELCDECIKAGPVMVGDRIRKYATELREQAQGLDALAGDLSKGELARWSTIEEVHSEADAVFRERLYGVAPSQ